MKPHTRKSIKKALFWIAIKGTIKTIKECGVSAKEASKAYSDFTKAFNTSKS